MNTILCNFNLFDLKQTILMLSEETNSYMPIGQSETQDLGSTIALLCDTYKVNKVRLIGHSSYAENIKKDILLFSKMTYNNNDIEVEIN